MIIGDILMPDYVEFECKCGNIFKLNHLEFHFEDLENNKRVYYGCCPECYHEVEKSTNDINEQLISML